MGGPHIKTYVRIQKNTFKQKWSGHKVDIRNESKINVTALRCYIRACKDAGVEQDVTLKFLRHASHFSPVTNRCNLCILDTIYYLRTTHAP